MADAVSTTARNIVLNRTVIVEGEETTVSEVHEIEDVVARTRLDNLDGSLIPVTDTGNITGYGPGSETDVQTLFDAITDGGVQSSKYRDFVIAPETLEDMGAAAFSGYILTTSETWQGVLSVFPVTAAIVNGEYNGQYRVETADNTIVFFFTELPEYSLTFRVYVYPSTAGEVSSSAAEDLQDEIDTINSNITILTNKTSILSAPYAHLLPGGRDLGTEITEDMYDAIDSGTFDGMQPRDFVTLNGRKYYFGHPDYWLNTGDTACTKHHYVMVPANSLMTGKMNSTNTTAGGYAGSDFRTGNNDNTALADVKTIIQNDFGSAHILTHREYLDNAVTNGKPSGGAWYDSDVDLMNERMVYGGPVFTVANDGTTIPDIYTTSKSQLAIFRLDPSRITNRATWWFRDPVSAAHFAYVHGYGYANRRSASDSLGIRPAFAICKSST